MALGGKAIIVVGGTGSGKTTFIKKTLAPLKGSETVLLYDVNNEYPEIYPFPLVNFQDFTTDAAKRIKSVIVFEEATIFLDSKGSNALVREMLVRKRHTQNTYFLLFHAFRFIPRYIYNLCTDVILFKTNDPENLITTRFDNEQLTEVFNRVQSGPKYYHERFNIY